jgi:hypothetical protein
MATEREPGKPLPDCGHLDEDAEALEDPVHSGDALHQQEQHERDAERERTGSSAD